MGKAYDAKTRENSRTQHSCMGKKWPVKTVAITNIGI